MRSRFEGLAGLTPGKSADNTVARSQRIEKLSENDEQLSTNYGRASLDLPRNLSPWTNATSTTEPTKRSAPQTPPSNSSSSPRRFGHSRPMSMSNASSPALAPAVLVESPRSPPRGHLFDRSSSRSPERRRFFPFSTSSSPPGSATSSRPTSRADTTKDQEVRPESRIGRSEERKSVMRNILGKGAPPPVNRADKPKIPPKPVAPLQVPEEASRRDSDVSDPRVSPFNTPPGSEGSPSPERLSTTRRQEPLWDRSSEQTRMNNTILGSENGLSRNSRIFGFGTRKAAEIPERFESKNLGLTSSSNGGLRATQSLRVQSESPTPSLQRTGTVPTRDSRTMGLSIEPPALPPPRRSQDVPRPLIPAKSPSHSPARDARAVGSSVDAGSLPRRSEDTQRPLIPSQGRADQISARPSRDPRSLGLSGAGSVIREEPQSIATTIPARTDSLPPPRPSEATKYKVPPARPVIVPPRPVDRATKPSVRQVESPISAATHFPPPPKRNTFGNESGPNTPAETQQPSRQGTNESTISRLSPYDSDEAEEDSAETFIARTDYPDTTQINRRPPLLPTTVTGIHTKHDARIFDVCGRLICTSGFATRVWDSETGENIMALNHGETVKVLSVLFKPAARLEDEGKRIWVGNNVGDLLEIDIETSSVVATSSVHNRREIIKIFRHKKDLWTLDDEGKLIVWAADESGTPNLKYSHHPHRVQRGYSFGIVIKDDLWLATGKDLHVYRPGRDSGFQVLQRPLSQAGAGEITAGAYSSANGDRVLFGYTDGKVVIHSTKDFTCLGTVKASDYKINAMAIVGKMLWAAYKTGKIYVYDTSVSPWKVKKDWKAHDGPVSGMVLDFSGIWTLNRLQITSLGQDNCIRTWDAMLEDDWLETAMQQRDVEYCHFREVRASIITWNVGASNPLDIRNDFIRDAIHVENPPEIIIFGFQELVDLEDRAVTAKNILGFGKKKKDTAQQERISKVYREWRDFLGRSINRYMGAEASYTELHTSSLIGLFLCVFVRQDQRRNIKGVNAANVKCGMGGHYGNKGALILRFIYDDSSMCFINCHLAAGQTQTSSRNNDIASILEAEALPPEPDLEIRRSTYIGGGDGTQVLDHEICILNGDLNYRIDAMPRNTVVDLIKRNELAKLLERDQIMVSRRRVAGFRLAPFAEAPITFAPTYKYDVGTDNYDTSEKKRSPAWCDRLLYRGPGRIRQTEYRRHEVRVSDHRPVSGTFKVRVKRIEPLKRAEVFDACIESFAQEKARIAADAR